MTAATESTSAPDRPGLVLLGAGLVGAAIAVALGVYGREHDAAGQALFTLGFSATLNMKAWLGTFVLVFAIVQVLLASWMYGKLGSRPAPEWVGPVHRIVGMLAFLTSLPIAYHCLWSLGFETDAGETRRFVHSVLGCAFYGAFVTKVMCVRSHRMPGWALPLVGGSLFAVLVGLWVTSSLWFFRDAGFPSFEARMDALHTLVRIVRAITLFATAALVFLLFTNEPQQPPPVPAAGTADTGAAIYETRCAGCHGRDGGGGFGPALAAGLVVEHFPDPSAQAALIANGSGAMPSFAESLTAEQIDAVVEYTRTL